MKAGEPILISDEVDLRAKTITRDRGEHYDTSTLEKFDSFFKKKILKYTLAYKSAIAFLGI